MNSIEQKYSKEFAEKKALDRAIIFRLLSYLKPYRWWIWLSVTLLFFAKAIEAFVPLYIGRTSQHIINNIGSSEQQKEEVLNAIFLSCFAIIGLLVFGYILDTITLLLKSWIGQRAIHTLRNQVYQHIQYLPINYFDRHAVGRLMTRTIHDVDQINQMFTESVIPIFGNAILFVGMCIGITIMDWEVGIFFAFIVPIIVWFTNRFRKLQRQCFDFFRNILSAMNSFVQEHLLGASIVRNFGLQEQEKKIFDEMNEDYRAANFETIHHFSFFISGIDFYILSKPGN